MKQPEKREGRPPERETARAKESDNGFPENGNARGLHQTEADGSFSEGDPDRPRWDNTTVLEAEYDYHREDGSYSHTVLKGRRADGQKAFLNGRRFDGSYSDLQLARQEGRKFYPFPRITLFEVGAGE